MNSKIREALKAYANPDNWKPTVVDSYSGEVWVFDWDGDLGDDPTAIAREALAALDDGWIPVSERDVPSDGGLYPVQLEDGSLDLATHDGGWGYDSPHSGALPHPVRWYDMPEPAPPKESSDG